MIINHPYQKLLKWKQEELPAKEKRCGNESPQRFSCIIVIYQIEHSRVYSPMISVPLPSRSLHLSSARTRESLNV